MSVLWNVLWCEVVEDGSNRMRSAVTLSRGLIGLTAAKWQNAPQCSEHSLVVGQVLSPSLHWCMCDCLSTDAIVPTRQRTAGSGAVIAR